MISQSFLQTVCVLGLAAVLAACGSKPVQTAARPAAKSGGYYLDDGPGDNPPANLDQIPDAQPRAEPLHRFANRSYVALGTAYTPQTERKPYRAEGVASWYGKRFHGKKTASGEPYDMYAMSAAHPTLPIPSYARVTALDSGKSVVVRVNDRGPFHSSRLIDLSYAAAHKLGVTLKGSLRVRVETVLGGEPEKTPDADPTGVGYHVQIGAFSRSENAESLARRVRQRLALDDSEVSVREVDRLHRVMLGPYPSAEAGRAVADRLRERMGLDSVMHSPAALQERF